MPANKRGRPSVPSPRVAILHVRVDPGFKEAIARVAAEDRRTPTDWIRVMLQDAIARHDKEGKRP